MRLSLFWNVRQCRLVGLFRVVSWLVRLIKLHLGGRNRPSACHMQHAVSHYDPNTVTEDKPGWLSNTVTGVKANVRGLTSTMAGTYRQIGPGTYKAFCPTAIGGPFNRDTAAQTWIRPLYYVSVKVKNGWRYTSTSPHVFMACRLINPLNAELNPICHLLALLGAHHILHVNRIRVNQSMKLRFKFQELPRAEGF